MALQAATIEYLKIHCEEAQRLVEAMGIPSLLQEEGPAKFLDHMIATKPDLPEADQLVADMLANRAETERVIGGHLGMM